MSAHGVERQREAGAGPKHDLVFIDRLLVTPAHLCTRLPHATLAEPYGTSHSTISRAIGEIRPLLAARLRRPRPPTMTRTMGPRAGRTAVATSSEITSSAGCAVSSRPQADRDTCTRCRASVAVFGSRGRTTL
ncbi:hypothetical protein [Streptomyces sp. CB01580]|uniref:hypothetical protein n=1 Tax=Streptomyces sp. CB01580 TaxID=1703933 RepID=UPI0013018558|nr:hypothetical protein [Streptomyces sp. CB01580]